MKICFANFPIIHYSLFIIPHHMQCDAYDHPCLTFWHWSGVTPYTSSYEFAGSCVFGKQSPGLFSCGHSLAWVGRPYSEVTVAVLPSSLRKTHLFALVYSTWSPVLVWGTVLWILMLRDFSWKRAPSNLLWRTATFPLSLKLMSPGFT